MIVSTPFFFSTPLWKMVTLSGTPAVVESGWFVRLSRPVKQCRQVIRMGPIGELAIKPVAVDSAVSPTRNRRNNAAVDGSSIVCVCSVAQPP